jgi:xylulokinase
MSCVLGIDIGTTSTIAILIDLTGNVLARASRPVTLLSQQQGWAEEDPEQWWLNVCTLVPELLAQAEMPATSVLALGVTGMLPTTVLLDKQGQLLRPSIQQSDGRTGEQVRDIASEINEAQFIAKAGNGINQQLIASRLRWIEKHEPSVFDRIATVFGSYDFINWRLTGIRACEQNWALEAGFVDLSTGDLSEELIALAHVPRESIPPKTSSHAILGKISAQAAAATGLATGTLVIGGAADHVASAYAAGIHAPGDVLLKLGGSADILIATSTPHPDRRMFLDYHILPGQFMPNGCMASGGSALNWFVQQFASGPVGLAKAAGMSPHQFLDSLAAKTPAGSDGVHILPYFLGEKTPIHDAAARGAIMGLSLNHEVRHVWRALLESFAYAFAHHVEVLNDMGHPTERFLASDGGANSQIWIQICADVLGHPVQTLKGHPGSCLGAAWLAAIGAGLTEDWKGVNRFITVGERFEPNLENKAIYQEGYKRYRASYKALNSVQLAMMT